MQAIDNLISDTEASQLWSSKPARAQDIQQAETALGVSFPPSYRDFLSRYGAISIGDRRCISGVIDNSPLDPGGTSVVGDTLRFRKEWQLPVHYVVIQADDDAPYCIDAQNRDAAGEAAVVCFELHSRLATVIARSFPEWVERFFA